MSYPRVLALFDPKAQPGSWNERMVAGEYAVHFSSYDASTRGSEPTCTVFATLPDAAEYASREVALRPRLRCRIYDHRGLVGAPVREINGAQYKGETEMTPRLRRWIGSVLLGGGVILIAVDWSSGFRLSWPAMIGTRMLLPALVLLFTEAMILLSAKYTR